MKINIFKYSLIRSAIFFSRMYFRYSSNFRNKMWLWNKLGQRYINWRDLKFVALTNSGLKINCDIKDTIQEKIIYFGVWEPNLTAFLERRLRSGDTFIDIGANIGYFSMLAAQLVGPQGKVLAIDASPSIFNLFQENLKLNNIKTVRSMNVAVADHEGFLNIYKAGRENIGATTTLANRGFQIEAQVRCAPLAAIATTEELREARIIKIDVEGAEAPILRDIIKNIDLFHPDVEIIAEISEDGTADSGKNWQIMFDKFAAIGFQAYELPNEYNFVPYINRSAPEAPRKLKQLPTKQFDVVLSRRADLKL